MSNKKSIMAILIAVLVVVGVTIAYFTTTTSFDNEFVTATYKTTSTEVFDGPTNWTPGEEIPKTITTKNEGSVDVAVRVSYTENWKDKNGTDLNPQPTNKVTINLDNTNEWTKEGNYYYYNYSLAPGKTTSSFMKSVTLNSNAITSDSTSCTTSADGKSKTCEATDPLAGAHYTLTLTIETIQYDAYDDTWNPSITIGPKPAPESFGTDSWGTIVDAVKDGDISAYNVGDTRTIEIDMDNNGTPEEYTLRIANKLTPEACNEEGFSQTACGFVIEFADILTTHRMNPYSSGGTVNGDGGKGGWEYSEMRTYVNSDIYNILPSDLKNAIIDTKVISGHGYSDPNNFITTDKIYLLSPIEVGIDVIYDALKDETRTLDYYLEKNNEYRIKKYNNNPTNWWLRSGCTNSTYGFKTVNSAGGSADDGSQSVLGVSPAFRIG